MIIFIAAFIEVIAAFIEVIAVYLKYYMSYKCYKCYKWFITWCVNAFTLQLIMISYSIKY